MERNNLGSKQKQLGTKNKQPISNRFSDVRRQNDNKAPRDIPAKKLKEPTSPVEPPDKNKSRGIVPIPRITVNKAISQPKTQ